MIPANLATIFARLGRADSARVYLDRALREDATNPMVAYCAALTCWDLSERDTALSWLGKSVQGGYPLVWLRDSPIFREWRPIPGFRELVGELPLRPQPAAARGQGERS